eukprot:5130611-Amphidinium_carterae.1
MDPAINAHVNELAIGHLTCVACPKSLHSPASCMQQHLQLTREPLIHGNLLLQRNGRPQACNASCATFTNHLPIETHCAHSFQDKFPTMPVCGSRNLQGLDVLSADSTCHAPVPACEQLVKELADFAQKCRASAVSVGRAMLTMMERVLPNRQCCFDTYTASQLDAANMACDVSGDIMCWVCRSGNANVSIVVGTRSRLCEDPDGVALPAH